jgi:hypothetical protein
MKYSTRAILILFVIIAVEIIVKLRQPIGQDPDAESQLNSQKIEELEQKALAAQASPTPRLQAAAVVATPTPSPQQLREAQLSICQDRSGITCVYEAEAGTPAQAHPPDCETGIDCAKSPTRIEIQVQAAEAGDALDPEAGADRDARRAEPYVCSTSTAGTEARGANAKIAIARAIATCESAVRATRF